MLTGSQVSKYAVNVARTLFSDDDLMYRMLSPQKDVGMRTKMDPEKVRLIKECVAERFPNEWHAAREAVNQHGRDIKSAKSNDDLLSLM